MADGALEGQPLADGALGPAGLAAAVAAVHPELCRHKACLFRTTGASSEVVLQVLILDWKYWIH